MCWIASTRYYIHKEKKNRHRGEVIAPFKKIKNMLGQNLLSILGDFLYRNKIANKKHKNTLLLA